MKKPSIRLYKCSGITQITDDFGKKKKSKVFFSFSKKKTNKICEPKSVQEESGLSPSTLFI